MMNYAITPSPMIAKNNDAAQGSGSFPRKLFAMLEDADAKDFSDIVAWQPGGNSFKVHKPKQFATTIMRQYFNQTRYKSFQKQLNLYGFQRIHVGSNRGGYEHPCMSQASPELCQVITRMQPSEKLYQKTSSSQNSTSAKNKSLSSPLFHKKTPDTSFSVRLKSEGLAMFSSDEDLIKNDLAVIPIVPLSSLEAPHSEIDILGLDQIPELEQLLEDTGNMLDMDECLTQAMDAISDEEDLLFGLIGGDEQDDTLECENAMQECSSPSSEHVFPRKLHLMLEDACKNGFEDIVSWVQGGAAFKVHDSTKFVEEIMPTYFDQTKYESFRRQLNMYGFNRVSRGVDKGMYFHEFFLAGDKRLCRNITRTGRPSQSSCTKTAMTKS